MRHSRRAASQSDNKNTWSDSEVQNRLHEKYGGNALFVDSWIRTRAKKTASLKSDHPFTRENGAAMIFDDKSELRYHHDDELMNLLEPDYR